MSAPPIANSSCPAWSLTTNASSAPKSRAAVAFSADQLDGLIERLLPPARDENVGAFFNEPLGALQRQAARSTRNDCNFSFKLSHNYSLR
jgi:hypothetical protein